MLFCNWASTDSPSKANECKFQKQTHGRLTKQIQPYVTKIKTLIIQFRREKGRERVIQGIQTAEGAWELSETPF